MMKNNSKITKPKTNTKAGSPPDISIVIPTYQRSEVLLNTINDVLNQSHKNIELLVVDQTKTHKPSTLKKLAAIKDPRFRYFSVDPPSVTASKNFALHNAKAEIVLFLDDDVELHKDLAKIHLKAFADNPKLSAVGGRVLQKGFPIQKQVLSFDELAVTHGVFTATEPGYTNAFPGGNVSMRVKDALSVGGFDTRYYLNAFREESDMSMKMTKRGMKIYFEPKAILTHLAAPKGGSRSRTYKNILDTRMFYANELFFTLRMAEHRIKALRHKHWEYCRVPATSKLHTLKRTVLFGLGLVAAVWRLVLPRKIVAKERPN